MSLPFHFGGLDFDQTRYRGMLEQMEYLVEQVGEDAIERQATVEQASHCTKQVAEQVAGTRLGGDVEDNPIEVDHQPKQIEIDRTEGEVQDLARPRCRQERRREVSGLPRGSIDELAGDGGGSRVRDGLKIGYRSEHIPCGIGQGSRARCRLRTRTEWSDNERR